MQAVRVAAVFEHGPQPRFAVAEGLVGLDALGDISEDADQSVDRRMVEQVADRRFDPAPRAVGVTNPEHEHGLRAALLQ